MDEREWDLCKDPDAMLFHAPQDDRVLRLLVCAFYRQQKWAWLTVAREFVELAEECADGEADLLDLRSAVSEAADTAPISDMWAMYWTSVVQPMESCRQFLWMNRGDVACVDAIREVLGNPWRLAAEEEVRCAGCGGRTARWGLRRRFCSGCDGTTDLPIVRWSTPAVLSIAERCYKERDWGALPVLADAMEDAGCASDPLLRHLRGWTLCPGCSLKGGGNSTDVTWVPLGCPHSRGCWALDLVLGRRYFHCGMRTLRSPFPST